MATIKYNPVQDLTLNYNTVAEEMRCQVLHQTP